MKKTCLLLSSGIDSVSALFLFNPDYAITVDLKARYNNLELLSLERIKEKAKKIGLKTEFITLKDTLNLSKYEQDDATIVLRNLYLLMLSCNELLYRENNLKELDLILVTQKDEMSIPDRTESFFQQSSKILSELTQIKVNCLIPFLHIDKTGILQKVIDDLGFNLARWMYIVSFSCYESRSGIECGNCPACFRKWVAGINNNLFFDIFEISPFDSEIKNRYLNKISNYSIDRQNRILNAIELYKNYKEKEI